MAYLTHIVKDMRLHDAPNKQPLFQRKIWEIDDRNETRYSTSVKIMLRLVGRNSWQTLSREDFQEVHSIYLKCSAPTVRPNLKPRCARYTVIVHLKSYIAKNPQWHLMFLAQAQAVGILKEYHYIDSWTAVIVPNS